MFFALIHFLLALLTIFRFWKPLNATKSVIRFGIALTLVSWALPYLIIMTGKTLDITISNLIFILSYGVSIAFVIFPGLYTFVRDVLVYWRSQIRADGLISGTPIQTDRRLALGVTAASAGLAAFGMYKGVQLPEVHRMDVPIKDLPDGLDGFTIAQLTDIHASSLLTEPHIRELVRRTNDLNADLIVVTGDIADGVLPMKDKDLAPIGDLSAPCGVWGCEGNHEHYVDYDDHMQRYAELGIRMLRNEWTTISKNGASFTLAGVRDPYARERGRELPNPILAFKGAPEKGLRILLSHQPFYARMYEQAVRFDLMLSGHTHGGQLRVLDYAVGMLGNGFVRGWYDLQKARLYVHCGCGTASRFPIRLGLTGEIALFTLRKAS